MKAREKGKRGELFEFVSDEGIHWLFVILPGDRWAISRNGESVATGTGDRRSLEAGVDKFMALTLIRSSLKSGATTSTPGA